VSFANPIPWWALAAVVVSAAAVAWLAYSRWRLPLHRRVILSTLRFVTLLALVLFLLRPVSNAPDEAGRHVVVPILVDTSRSMSIEDGPRAADGRGARRIDRARQVIVERLLPSLEQRFTVEVLSFGERLAAADPRQLSSSARESNLEGALNAVRDRYRGRPVAGIVLLSDGGDTSSGAERAAALAPPVFAIGVGAAAAGRDREVLSVTAAEQTLDEARVDLEVSAVSHGLGTTPIELRLLENGRPIDVRRSVPAADGTPVREVFQVTPARGAPAVYTVETPTVPGELVPENNARSVLVQAPTRPRRVLLVEGAPGFEHSFLRRAWTSDPGLEIDAVVRKGRDDRGSDTFYVRAARSRSDSLAAGYPATRDALFAYDALVLANVEGHQFTRAQLESARAFVGRRGGGLLVLGARSFLTRGLVDTPLEEVLPLDLSDQGGVVAAAAPRGANRVSLTTAGETHPVMQLATGSDETRRRWAALPALASITAIGGPRPGASVLAVSGGPGGGPRPLVAVQRFGEGRAMVFAGEASWRWRMMLPAADRSFDTFWKQAVRWIGSSATEPVHIVVPQGPAPGVAAPLRVLVRNAAFEPQPGATVDVRVTAPDGRSESVAAVAESGADAAGRFVAEYRPPAAGVYRIGVDARSGATALGAATASMLVGGADLEMTDPRVNRQSLERVASASGGRVIGEDQAAALGDMLKGLVPAAQLSVRRDLWHNGWSFAAILALLGAEWVSRRRWGMR
jgi:uncharacterized membrane protein